MADLADTPAGENAWRLTVQISDRAAPAPTCAPSCSVLADPCTRLHELIQMIEHNGPIPMAARHLHLVMSAQAAVSECITDPPSTEDAVIDDDESSPGTSDPAQSHLVADLARSISVAALTSDEVDELRQFASRVHYRLALLRGVFPEPPALQSSSWLTTRAYIASRLEHLSLDLSASVPVALSSSSSRTPP